MSERPELRLQLQVKNNVLWHAIYDKYGTVANFCRRMAKKRQKFSQSDIGQLISFKLSPFRRHNSQEYTDLCERLELALGIPADQLFPRHLYEKITVSKQVIEVNFAALPGTVKTTIAALPAPAEENPQILAIKQELGERLEAVLRTLTFREQEILKYRYALDGREALTLEEVGVIFKISRDRVRQVEARAIRKLQHPVRYRKLESFVG